MAFFKDIWQGVKAYGPASGLLFSRGIWHFMLWPIVIAVLLFVAGGALMGWLGDWCWGYVEGWLEGWLGEKESWGWVRELGGVLMWLITGLIYYLFFMMFGGYVVMMVMSPIYSWLSERGEHKLTGVEYPFSWRQFGWEVWRGIVITLRGMFLQLLTTVVLMFFSFIPVVGVVGPLLIFLTGAYFYGFTFMDYAIERKRLRVRETERFVWHHAGVAVGVGMVFMLVMMVPGIRWVACCFVSLLSVLAGTVVVNDLTSTEGTNLSAKGEFLTGGEQKR